MNLAEIIEQDLYNATGKKCSRCGEVKPMEAFCREAKSKDGRKSRCRECVRLGRIEKSDSIKEYAKRYYAEHKEDVLEAKRMWYRENAEWVKEYNRAYNQSNKSAIKKKVQEWREKNAEHRRAYARAYREANPHRDRKWRQENPYKARAKYQLRHKRVREAPGSGVTEEDIIKIRNGQTDKHGKVRCWYCKCVITIKTWHLDHAIPVSKGGAHDPGNIRLACRKCNLSKGPKTPMEFAGRLL